MEPTVFGLTWQVGSYSGWGVYGLQIILHAIRSRRLVPVPFCAMDNIDRQPLFDRELAEIRRSADEAVTLLSQRGGGHLATGFPVLHALGNQLVRGTAGEAVRGKPDHGLVFLEDTALTPQAVEAGRRFRTIAAGSTWNAEVLRSAGLDNVTVAVQGVDPAIFHPAPRLGVFRDRFVIFSGGKLEYRKGQDIVIEVFRRFRERHPEALLLAAWFNPWAGLSDRIAQSPWVKGAPRMDGQNRVMLSEWLMANGLPAGSFHLLNAAPNVHMGAVVREADVALFPNRCEGGTNLVAMECLASGVPTVLSANTGHLDLVRGVPCYPLREQSPVTPERPGQGVEGWGESSVEEAVEALERIYSDRQGASATGQAAAAAMRDWSWSSRISHLFASLDLPAGHCLPAGH